MRPGDIEFPLRYLRELDGAVRAAIDDGRSVEATLDVAAMPDYGAPSCLSGRITRSTCPPPIVTYKKRQRNNLARSKSHELENRSDQAFRLTSRKRSRKRLSPGRS
jgi:hypothetical protein